MVDIAGFNLVAILLSLAAIFGLINHRWLHLPHTIGLLVIALFVSFGVIAVDAVAPGLGFQQTAADILDEIDFSEALMKGMLSFLLFAGALHVDLEDLASRKWAITAMATLGVLMSTAIISATLYGLTMITGLQIPFIFCLLFGALISPTDPIAVLGILKSLSVPDSLRAKIAGESLFNDGVGIVVFTIIAAFAVAGEVSAEGTADHGAAALSAAGVAELFIREAIGGAVLGLLFGYAAYRAMKSIDEYNLEVLITLALVTMTYAVAFTLHMSGPIAVVVAGLLIGNHGTRFAMSATTRDHINKFWGLTDEMLNSVLFLLIGFEVFALAPTTPIVVTGIAVIPVVLAARFISVGIPLKLLSRWERMTKGAIPVLTWGGLRGGISVALALSLPDSPDRATILALTYGVVIFSVIVQGLTIKGLVQRAVVND